MRFLRGDKVLQRPRAFIQREKRGGVVELLRERRGAAPAAGAAPTRRARFTRLTRRRGLALDLGHQGEALVGRLLGAGLHEFAIGGSATAAAAAATTGARRALFSLFAIGAARIVAIAICAARLAVATGRHNLLLLALIGFCRDERLIFEDFLLERLRADGIDAQGRGRRREARPGGRLAALKRVIIGARERVVRGHGDMDAEAQLQRLKMRALLVEDVERDDGAGAQRHIMRGALEQRLLQHAQHMQRDGGGGANMARARAMRADHGRAFHHAGADALARHFEQAEMRDAADLDAGAIVLERVLQPALDGAIVPALLHVDKIDDDETGEIAQAQLAGDFVRRLQIGAQRRVLDIVLARRAARVHVDRHQRFGLVDDQIAAGFQRHMIGEHGVELGLDPGLGEDRRGLAVELHILGMARHEHAHEVLGLAVGVLARDHDLLDVAAVKIADGALDERAFLIDEGRRRGTQRQFAHALPEPQQIFEIALDLGLGARRAGRAQDDAHALRHFEVVHDLLETLAVGAVGDLAGDAAAARRIGHEHRITAGEREIGGERRALVAALLFHDLHEQHLTALDDFLDLVLTARARHAEGRLVHRVAANMLDVLFLVVLFVLVVVRLIPGRGAGGDLGRLEGVLVRGLAIFRIFLPRARLVALVAAAGLQLMVGGGRLLGKLLGSALLDRAEARRIDGNRMMALVGVRLDDMRRLGQFDGLGLHLDVGRRPGLRGFGGRRVLGRRKFAFHGGLEQRLDVDRRTCQRLVAIGALLGALLLTATRAAAAAAMRTVLLLLMLAMGAALFFEQRLTVGDGDLVIIRMDFGEGEKAVAVAAVIDESRLKRRLHPRDLGEINIAAQRFLFGGLEIEFLYAITAKHHHPGFFRVGGVDEHFVCHEKLLGALRGRRLAARAAVRSGMRRRRIARARRRERFLSEKGEEARGLEHAGRREGRRTDRVAPHAGQGRARRRSA